MARLYVPKGLKISQIGDERLLEAEWHMKTLPRKALGYRTPEEVFDAHLDKLQQLEAGPTIMEWHSLDGSSYSEIVDLHRRILVQSCVPIKNSCYCNCPFFLPKSVAEKVDYG
ncbi:MAG: hypothetical protein FWG10_04925 [Eubacteriaceae bacterium]|nr:hypothetical protein [Eubacteriaceae bacterium]